jgi:hypothetical protein
MRAASLHPLLLPLCAAALAACQSRPQAPAPAMAFDPVAAAHVHKKGEGRIEGQAFLVTPEGSTKIAAGETIRLIPATPYAEATVTSSGGAFRFDDVAPGAYILSGQKIWREPGAFAPQGGAMYARVTVEGAERRKVILVGR